MDRSSQISNIHFAVKPAKGIGNVKKLKLIERNHMVEEIKKAVDELENIRKFYEFAVDSELIDYAIYREKAALMKLSYLFKKAKENKNTNIDNLKMYNR